MRENARVCLFLKWVPGSVLSHRLQSQIGPSLSVDHTLFPVDHTADTVDPIYHLLTNLIHTILPSSEIDSACAYISIIAQAEGHFM